MKTKTSDGKQHAASSRRRPCGAVLAVCVLGACIVASSTALHGVDIPLVAIGDAGNAADSTGFGAVADSFRIGKHEVTNGEYAAFLNAVATEADPNGLWNESMEIAQSGSPGSFAYETSGPDLPVTFVSWYDAVRFANWLHNGQPSGPQGPSTTEDGAYTILDPADVSPRNAGARYFLPSENEWYKAAYYEGGATPHYYLYPTGSDEPPAPAAPSAGPDVANYDGSVGGVSPVGSYPGASGPYGTLDQAGNVWEWTESVVEGLRGIRGGSWDDYPLLLDAWYRDADPPSSEHEFLGFRIAAASLSGPTFRRGDANQDSDIDISDGIAIFSNLFLGDEEILCVSAADANDDAALDISDGVTVLEYLFLSTAIIPEPLEACGVDPTPDDLGCEAFPECFQN